MHMISNQIFWITYVPSILLSTFLRWDALFSFALLETAILGNVTLISIITISTTFYGTLAEEVAKREVLWL